MSLKGLGWVLCTVLALPLAYPMDWRVGLLCCLAALAPSQRHWLAICVTPIWLGAVLNAHWLAMVLVLWSITAIAQGRRGWLWVVLGLAEGVRVHWLTPVLPGVGDAYPALVLSALVVGGLLDTTPSGKGPAGLVLMCGCALGLQAWQSSQTVESRADIEAAARTNTLRMTSEIHGDALRLWTVRVDPLWHGHALMLPLEQSLAMGWRPQTAPLSDAQRVEVARVLERWGRGGEALRVLAQGSELSHWWQIYFQRAAQTPASWTGSAVPDAAHVVGHAVVDASFLVNGTQEIPLHFPTPAAGVVLVASADWFEGAPEMVVWLDGVRTTLSPSPQPERHSVMQPLDAGPHRLTVEFSDDRWSADGDRNVYLHEVTAINR